MNKIKISADAVLGIIQSVFNHEDVNYRIDDSSAPECWRDKTLSEALNVDYYTFKHRPVSSEKIIADLIADGKGTNELLGLTRSFCLVSLSGLERLFSKDVDMATVSVEMEYWLQTSKVKLLEDLIEECNIRLSGWRIPVPFGKEQRQAVVIFDRPQITDIQPQTQYGEMAVCEINASILFYPDVVSYKDYEVKISYVDNGVQLESEPIPLSSFSYVNTMTQKAVPSIGHPQLTGSINLARANSFVLVFDGYNNGFINYLADKSLLGTLTAGSIDNNEALIISIKRGDTTYAHNVIIKDHQVTVNADTSNETHVLSLVTRGI